MSKHPKYHLRVKLQGPGIRPKSIRVPDLLRLCEAIQSAVYRQAEALEGSRTLRPGPVSAAAHEECTLDLIGLGGGSTVLSFRLAKPQQPLPIPGTTTFGLDVVAKVACTVRALGTHRKTGSEEFDAGVLDSLERLGELLGKKSVSGITFTVPPHSGTQKITASFNRNVYQQVVGKIKRPIENDLTVEGTLEMADFKESGKVCRIHPPVGLPIQCVFDPAREEEVYQALRKPVRLKGTATINPHTGRPEELHIQRIEIIDQLIVGAKDFFISRSIDELAEAQGVKPLLNPGILAGGWPDDENLDDFLEATYQARSA